MYIACPQKDILVLDKKQEVPHGNISNNWICCGCDASRGHRKRPSSSFSIFLFRSLSLSFEFSTAPKCSMQPLIVLLIGGKV